MLEDKLGFSGLFVAAHQHLLLGWCFIRAFRDLSWARTARHASGACRTPDKIIHRHLHWGRVLVLDLWQPHNSGHLLAQLTRSAALSLDMFAFATSGDLHRGHTRNATRLVSVSHPAIHRGTPQRQNPAPLGRSLLSGMRLKSDDDCPPVLDSGISQMPSSTLLRMRCARV